MLPIDLCEQCRDSSSTSEVWVLMDWMNLWKRKSSWTALRTFRRGTSSSPLNNETFSDLMTEEQIRSLLSRTILLVAPQGWYHIPCQTSTWACSWGTSHSIPCHWFWCWVAFSTTCSSFAFQGQGTWFCYSDLAGRSRQPLSPTSCTSFEWCIGAADRWRQTHSFSRC